jgi:hypothetical protein
MEIRQTYSIIKEPTTTTSHPFAGLILLKDGETEVSCKISSEQLLKIQD